MRVYRGYEVRLRLDRRNRDYQPIEISSPRAMAEFMCDLGTESAEHACQLLMDIKRRVQGVYEIGKGGIEVCVVDPREVFKAALATNSPVFAVAHNHPSGVVEPSPDDERLAERLVRGSEILGLELADFLIMADTRYYSFLEAGRLHRKAG